MGEWVENRMQGKGKLNFGNGDIYDGEWVEGKMHGKGIIIKLNGVI